MIYPSIDEITKGQYNRYTLCIATAKCARIVTDEYVEQREIAEKMLANKETDKSLASMIKREIRDEKAVKTAIKRLYNGDFVICCKRVSYSAVAVIGCNDYVCVFCYILSKSTIFALFKIAVFL